MKLVLTTTKDVVTGEMTQAPQMFRNTAEAVRAWGFAIKQLRDEKSVTPVTDLQLYKIGEIDTETMEIKPCVEYLATGGQFIAGE